MNFTFDVRINDQDYLDYNVFWMLRSPYGKKTIIHFRILFTVLFVLCMLLLMFGSESVNDVPLGLIPPTLVLLFANIFLGRACKSIMKWHINALHKTGKRGYSPQAVLTFYEDRFVETAPENKTEQAYTAIERVSLVDSRVLYIHINTLMAYILPLSCFESQAQYTAFLDFMRTKCTTIDVY